MLHSRSLMITLALAAAPALPAGAADDASPSHRQYRLTHFGDSAVVQVYADGFEKLPLHEKIVAWHADGSSMRAWSAVQPSPTERPTFVFWYRLL